MSMTNIGHSVVRKLAEWNPDDIPITSVYLTVDGRRYPRKSDYEVRLDNLLRRGRAQAEGEGLSKDAMRSVLGDLEAIGSFVRESKDGFAVVSSSPRTTTLILSGIVLFITRPSSSRNDDAS